MLNHWSTDVDIPLVLALLDEFGNGVSGKTPSVAIRRHHSPTGALDGFFWNGSSFQSAPFYFTMAEMANVTGVYTYLFRQTLVGLETTYLMQFQHTVDPIGFTFQLHDVTSDLVLMMSKLTTLDQNIVRALGLLHQNTIIDNQTYDGNGQITAARIRVFDSAGNVPATPGGSETTGLLHRYAMTAAYAGIGLLSNYTLKKEL